jgi:hypothetical protein
VAGRWSYQTPVYPTLTPRPTFATATSIPVNYTLTVTARPSSTPQPSCPAGGTLINNGTQCQYTYNPILAVQYALKWNTVANPLFCRYNYPGTGQTCSSTNATDCTNFTSQAILYGGLPMTQYIDPNSTANAATEARWLCQHSAGGVCQRIPDNWSGAEPSQNPGYFFSFPNPVKLSRLAGDHVTQPPSRGTQIDPENIEQNSEYILTNKLISLGIGTGDLLYMEYEPNEISANARPHMSMIVGWDPYLYKWDQFELTMFNIDYWYEPTLTAAKNKGGQDRVYVPYIVDHGLHGENNVPSGNYSSPRPYYFLFWNPQYPTNIKGLNQLRAPPSFLRVPRTIVYPIPPQGDIAGRVPVELPYNRSQLWNGVP